MKVYGVQMALRVACIIGVFLIDNLTVRVLLIPGAAAPKLVRRDQLTTMLPGAALVDVAIDQGGCFETSRPTTHQDPIYEVDGVMHYCVANMPGAVARTSTLGLTNATLPFVVALAEQGWRAACTSGSRPGRCVGPRRYVGASHGLCGPSSSTGRCTRRGCGGATASSGRVSRSATGQADCRDDDQLNEQEAGEIVEPEEASPACVRALALGLFQP